MPVATHGIGGCRRIEQAPIIRRKEVTIAVAKATHPAEAPAEAPVEASLAAVMKGVPVAEVCLCRIRLALAVRGRIRI
jgi:hypothetical protein